MRTGLRSQQADLAALPGLFIPEAVGSADSAHDAVLKPSYQTEVTLDSAEDGLAKEVGVDATAARKRETDVGWRGKK